MEDSEELKTYKEEVKESVNKLMGPWTLLLKAHHVVTVTTEYSGGGDSGQIDNVYYVSKLKGKEPESGSLGALVGQEKAEQFEELMMGIMDHRGWAYNDDGGCGSLTWNLEDDTFKHEDSQYYTESNDTTYLGLDGLEGIIEEHVP